MFKTQLKKLREENGYKSQQSFADAIGVSQSTVGNWESGTREPNLNLILKIANKLNVSVDELLGNTQLTFSESDPHRKQSGYWDGSRLSESRIAQGFSTKQLSSMLEISEEDYLQLEAGETEPTFTLMLRLADVFFYDLDYLCHRTMKIDGASSTLPSAEDKLLLSKFHKLPQQGKDFIWTAFDYALKTFSAEDAPPTAKNA